LTLDVLRSDHPLFRSGFSDTSTMTTEPTDAAGVTMTEWIAGLPEGLSDIPVGMWMLVPNGRIGFGLEGSELADFIRRCIHTLMDAGAKPVVHDDEPHRWKLQMQYGSDKHEVAEAVIGEWLRQGAPTPEPWDGVWFGLPRSWLQGQ
jgi:hypothetical protein